MASDSSNPPSARTGWSEKKEEAEAIARQTRAEHRAFLQLQNALEGVLQWKTEGPTFTRKLSCIRFMFRSFHDFLERLMDIEEYDGYMNIAINSCPSLVERVTQLQAEHEEFRASAASIATTLDRLLPTDHQGLVRIGSEISAFLAKLDRHSQKELDLVFESLLRELGEAT